MHKESPAKCTPPKDPAFCGHHVAVKEELDSLESVTSALVDLLGRITNGPSAIGNEEQPESSGWSLQTTLAMAPNRIEAFREETLTTIREISDALFG